MSDINQNDLLNQLDSMDLSSIPTGIPMLPPGLYEVEVRKMEVVPTRKGDGNVINVTLGLTQPATDVNGNHVNAGFPIYDSISLSSTPKYDPRPRLAEFKESFTGTKTGTFTPIDQYVGLTAMVRVKIEVSAEYGDKNRVQRYVKKG